MVDDCYTDPVLVALYDVLNPWAACDEFYLSLLLSATAVLDVGCGTGRLLHRAREAGHTGRLCGLDPAEAMLARARRRQDVEWVLGDLTSVTWNQEFDLVVMTGHAFQVLLGDDELRTALTTIHTALVPGGRFAFETRNPSARGWERWTSEDVDEVTGADGEVVRVWHEVETPVDGDLVRFTTTASSPSWSAPRTSRSTLRFLDVPTLSGFLTEAGFVVEEQFGHWDRSPVTATSPEIITVARRP